MTYKILCIDDDALIVEVLQTWFSGQEIMLQGETSAFLGLDLVNSGHYDLILLDILMEEMSGAAVLAKIRKKYNKLDLPVIMISTIDRPKEVVELLDHGANDYIIKPLHLGVVNARVKTHLKMKEIYQKQKILQQEHTAVNNRLLKENSDVNSLLDSIIDSILTPLVVFDTSGKLSRASKSFLALMEWEVIPEHDIISSDIFGGPKCIVTDILNSKEEMFMESSRIIGKDNKHISCKLKGAPVIDKEEHIVGVVIEFYLFAE